jgi:Pyridoxamine 5'-phosphate oxidase
MNSASPHLSAELEKLLDSNKLATLATVGGDGMPRLSVVYYAHRGERIFISTLRERLKAKDIERKGWAALSVRGEEPPYSSATFSGRAVLRTIGIGEDTALVMGRITGLPEPPEPQTDEALGEVGRVLIEITIDRVSAESHL